MRAGLTMLIGTAAACRKAARSRPQLPVASMQACTGAAGSGRCLASQASSCSKPASVLGNAAWRTRAPMSRAASNLALAMSMPSMSMEPPSWLLASPPVGHTCNQAVRHAGALDTVQPGDG